MAFRGEGMRAAALILLAALLPLIFFSGCISVTKESDCAGMDEGSKTGCLYDAAVGYALFGNKSSAVRVCKSIDSTGWLLGSSERDQCLMDIAEITKDPGICNDISVSQSGDFSSAITRNLCMSRAEEKGEPTCFSLFVLPGLFALALFASTARAGPRS